MRPFQIILIGIFGALALGGLIMFAAYRVSNNNNDPLANGVTIWGTFDQNAFAEVLSTLSSNDDRWSRVRYERKDPRTFSEVLVESIAEGTGPDLILIPSELLMAQLNKLQPISYQTYPLRTFKDTFVDGAEIFALPAGIYGIPLAVDPLVMYWNRNAFSSAGLAYAPRTWEELVGVSAPAITRRSNGNDVQKSTIAFGEYSNVRHAKESILMLLLQAGSKLITFEETKFVVDLNVARGKTNLPPADYALGFFMEFSNPSRVTYNWNRALPEDRELFLSESLALYFGFGSEFQGLRRSNANLNLDIMEVPEPANATDKVTYGSIYAFAIPKSSHNLLGAYETASTIALGDAADVLSRKQDMAPARRDLIAKGSGSAEGDVIYRSALISRSWWDPKPETSDTIFRTMVEDVNAGRLKVSEAIDDASYKLQQAFR